MIADWFASTKRRIAMLASAILAISLAGAAAPPPPAGREAAIPRIGGFLEWVDDGKSGVYIRGDTGKWYYARTREACPRLRPHVALSFGGAVLGQLDRYGSLVVEGWRCQLASVVESGPPPGYSRPHRR
jgi:hypothetical protein